jgi:hypothetical protein
MIRWGGEIKSQMIYISGKYSSDDPDSVRDNTGKAIEAVVKIIEKGHTPCSPHLMFPDLGDKFDSPVLQLLGLNVLEKCDAVYFLPGYRQSSGAMSEYRYAINHNKETYFDIDQIKKVTL